ncbi:MAG: hypothetical protein KC464_34025, partial [Myxococcales bacterium]|nr:hypothetical protein [Myxococcales bacterium]
GFSAEMSNGRGYLALAIVILGGWRPAVVAITCLGLGLVEAFAYQVQLELQTRAAAGHGPSDLEQLTGMLAHVLPYLLTLAFLALLPQRARTPRALGRADDAL